MKSHFLIVAGACAAILLSFDAGAAQEWKLKGDWAESCCCQAACPCVFGSAPSRGYCEGSALFEIQEGRYGDVVVDGLAAVITYRMGEWLRVYVDDDATDEQVDAVVKLLNQDETFGMLFAGEVAPLSAERADIQIAKSDSKIAFSVPEAEVEMEAMTGPNGEPIHVQNLSVPWFVNGYTQYKVVSTSHERGDVRFEYSDTNGATSHVEASGVLGEGE